MAVPSYIEDRISSRVRDPIQQREIRKLIDLILKHPNKINAQFALNVIDQRLQGNIEIKPFLEGLLPILGLSLTKLDEQVASVENTGNFQVYYQALCEIMRERLDSQFPRILLLGLPSNPAMKRPAPLPSKSSARIKGVNEMRGPKIGY